MKTIAYNAEDVLHPRIGPYSRAIQAGNLLFLSGHAALDHDGQVIGPGDATVQTERVLANLELLLHAAGATLENVVSTTTYLTDMADLPKVQEAKRRILREPFPTSTTVGVRELARPGLVIEIDAIAVVP